MSKKVLIILTVCAVITLLAVLVGCESYKYDADLTMGDNNAVVTSNGGTVVKQGDYIYFVNGYADYKSSDTKANWFGNVVKGAICRIKADATTMDEVEVVVPKSVMCGSTNFGFSIYGDYIYYVSPGVEEEKGSTTVKTSIIQFLRTRLDGQKTVVMYEIEDQDVSYTYTSTSLVYLKDNTLYSKSLTEKSYKKAKDGEVLAEDIASVHFPVATNTSYDRGAGETFADYFYYTKIAEGNNNYAADLYVCNGSGSINKIIAGGDNVSYSSLNSYLDATGITLYYTKTPYHGSSAGNAFFCGIKIKANEFSSLTTGETKLNATNEKVFAQTAPTSIYALDIEVGYINYTSGLVYVNGNGETAFSATSDEITVKKPIALVGKVFYYVDTNSDLVRKTLSTEESERDNVTVIVDDAVDNSYTWICPEMVDGKIYFCLTSDSYLYRITVADFKVVDGAMTPELVGKKA